MSTSEARRTAHARRPRLGRSGRWLAGLATVVFLAPPLASFARATRAEPPRPADLVVVFGAGVKRSGGPSIALADRVDEGIRLAERGLAPTLFLSGGPSDEGLPTEPAVMRERALRAGIRAETLVLDEGGVSTSATVTNATAYLRAHGGRRVLAVSHYYHLPRIRMLFEEAGVEVDARPCRMSRRLRREPWYLLRECFAFWIVRIGLDGPRAHLPESARGNAR